MAEDKQELSLLNSVNTANPNEDLHSFSETEAPYIENTGIERDGGITNLHLETETYTETGAHFIADDGSVLSVIPGGSDLSTVKIGDKIIGSVSSYGVEKRLQISGVEDCIITVDNSYVTAVVNQSNVILTEYDFNNAVLHTRTITFTSLGAVSTFFASLSIVRYEGMHYADSFEFALRLGDQVIVLQESNSGISFAQAFSTASVLGTNNINAIIVYKNWLVAAGDGGRVGSYDGQNWKNYDGSGIGTGPYANGTVVSFNNINCMAVYGNSLVVGANGGLIASFDGTKWLAYNSSGTGLYNNASVISTDNVTALATWSPPNSSPFLVVGGSAGKLGSWNGTAWTLYNAASGVCDNATLLGAVSINAIASMNNLEGGSRLLVAGANGRVANASLLGGATWNFVTTPVPASGWVSASYGNGVWIAVANTTSTTAGVARSTDNGLTWSFVTTPAPASGWVSASYGNGVWVAVANSTSTTAAIARSTDNGLTWSFVTTPAPANDWVSASYGNGVWIAVADTTSTTAGVARSTDNGLTWSFVTTPAPANGWYSVAYGNGVWIAVANTTSTTAGIARSTDNGLTWSFVTTPAPEGYGWSSVSYGNGVWIAVAYTDSTTTAGIARSTDNGVTWNFVTTPAPDGGWASVSYGNGVWIAVAYTTSATAGIARSTDNGLTWNFVTTPAPAGVWTSVSYGNGVWVAVANSTSTTAAIARSTDNGATWNFVTTTAPGGSGWNTIAYGNGVWIATAYTTSTTAGIARSTDQVLSKNIYTVTDPRYGPTADDALGGNNILAANIYHDALTHNTYFVIGGVGGRLASYDGIDWSTYGAAQGINSFTVLGTADIRTISSNGSNLVVAGTTGLVGSFDGSNWKNYDGTDVGTGIYNNATVLGSVTLSSSAYYCGNWVFSGSNAVNSIAPNNSFTISDLLTGLTNNSYLYVYRYENGMYLINLVGNALNRSYILDNTTKTIKILNAGWAIPQVKNGLSRHILTTTNPDYTTDATQVRGTGLVGYTDFANFSADAVYPDNPYAGSAILSKVAGFGYEDFNFRITTSPTDIYNYTSPQPYVNAGGLFQVKQSNTDTLINYYGKMNNNLAVAPTKPIEFRLGMIPTLNSTLGVQSYISAALVDNGSVDNLGVLLTNVGEFDYSYTPQLVADSQILYRYNKNFYIITVSKNPVNPIQRVSEKLYKINSITPLNLIDINSKTLLVGSSDYNGRLFFTSSASPAGSKIAIASIQSNEFANSIDVGDKLLSYYTVTTANFEAIGYRIPSLSASQQYEIDVYVADTYYASILNGGSELVSPAKTGILYTNTPTSPKIIPEAIGQLYVNGTISTLDSTIIMEPDYDGYRIGNQLNGIYTVFTLNNGYSYLFDGSFIYTITLDSVGFITNKRKVAPAGGLKYLATAPTEAYFLSTFDNSIYTFSGGQSLVKARRMNRVDDIQNAVFNVRDNTLLLNATNQLIWVRDSVLTLNEKLPAQTGLRLYSTENGIYLGNDVNSWRYTFKPTDSSVVVPLKWRSAFFGITSNIKSIVSEYVCTIYDESKSAHKIVGKVFTRDPDTYTTQTETWEVTPNMYTDGGYVTLRLKPQTMKSLGTSIGLECNDKIIILDVTAQFALDTNAVVEAKRSR